MAWASVACVTVAVLAVVEVLEVVECDPGAAKHSTS